MRLTYINKHVLLVSFVLPKTTSTFLNRTITNMGGNAFKEILPTACFPRMSPAVYNALKAHLLMRLEPLYEVVAVPHEAPEKVDHGDVDFVAAQPRQSLTHEMVMQALGAMRSIPQDGGPMCNFAIPVHAFELGAARADSPEAFYQVDVNVCADRAEWERVVFMHSYGDLGMILNLLARSAGVVLGTHGLKLANPLPTSPPITFYLTTSIPDVLSFFGLSMDQWAAGFASQRAVFDWAASSTLFDAPRLARRNVGRASTKKALEVRTMYQAFLMYACERAAGAAPRAEVTQDAALRFFGKDAEHDALLHAARARQHAREVFTGKLVEEWTGVRGVPVRWVMDGVRERLGGELREDGAAMGGAPVQVHGAASTQLPVARLTPWESAMFPLSVDEVRALVIQVKDEMQAAGKLEFDWRAAKARKMERKLMQQSAEKVDIPI
ncbi:hypothetical protein B0H21DRAFT_499013 [Amylocystis lapponica]|nr:hypothetical protein B0H21DRAFT_499013 [Amylocystis lapponica]